ncbi:MAG: hypothetical protein ACOX9R_18840 [Armatimonadota bacterium]|jgi:SAM-dependent methyltransferase
MWTIEQLLAEAIEGRVGRRFRGRDEVQEADRADLTRAGERSIARPQEGFGPVGRRVLAAQWALLLEAIDLPARPRVLELCAGGSDPVVVALDAVFGASAEYVTMNLNRKLAAELTERTEHLELEVQIVEDDAQNLRRHYAEDTFDCVCFHHAVNDILQTAIATARGMDTREIDWWPTERTMIEWMAEQYREDQMTSVGRPELRRILGAAVEVVKPGGFLCFDHWTAVSSLEQDWFPGDLFNDMVVIAREEALLLSAPLEEVTPAGLDRRWWMVLKRV